ncbi:DUF4178 domain-containing protein [Rubripirellula sp.]|nr:DUF4178 domain-containing protein [Rubripirellula sp.]MDB4533018.1 DUF4178 domain-containing protein [bacterium]MDB4624722.1 DUF4178 domain-containing protein [Rubripirellula sp.]
MKRRKTACPSCGGPIEFTVGSMVSVCEFCQSAVARTDRKVEDVGKVAELVQTPSRLRCGLSGTFNKKHFNVVGRVQYQHPAGGVWDEWYLAFPGGRWGWLAEAQGKTYLMFQRKITGKVNVPGFDELEVGSAVKLGDSEFSVTERGIATALAAEGDIPWAFRGGVEHQFADLQGLNGVFATFEYGASTNAYVGKEVSLDSLALEGDGWDVLDAHVVTSAASLNCPKCGGALTLHAPDAALRVTCPNCNSLLDADNGKLTYLQTLSKPKKLKLQLQLGTEGKLFGDDYIVIGFLGRFAMYAGVSYPWQEYLLYSERKGFRWLVYNDRHWSFASPASGAAVKNNGASNRVSYDGASFRIYDRGVATVKHVLGEFYWKVEAGEKVKTADYIAPPRMLSYEWSETAKSSEVNVSECVHVPTEVVEAGFGVENLPRSFSVGPIQPAPSFGKGLFLTWPALSVLMIVIYLAFARASVNQGADPWLCFYGLMFISALPIGILFYMYSFERKRWEDSDYSPYATE